MCDGVEKGVACIRIADAQRGSLAMGSNSYRYIHMYICVCMKKQQLTTDDGTGQATEEMTGSDSLRASSFEIRGRTNSKLCTKM